MVRGTYRYRGTWVPGNMIGTLPSYRDVPWVMDSHWIIASVLRITCALFSIFSGYEMAEA